MFKGCSEKLGHLNLHTLAIVLPYFVFFLTFHFANVFGSTRGLGKALAREFLRAGDNVVVASRRSLFLHL